MNLRDDAAMAFKDLLYRTSRLRTFDDQAMSRSYIKLYLPVRRSVAIRDPIRYTAGDLAREYPS